MRLEAYEAPSIFSRWTSRVALFSALIIVTAAVLHRLFGMPTPVAFNLVRLALAGAVVALALGLAAALGIWQTGRSGASRAVLGVLTSLILLSLPLIVVAKAREYPEINDLTTDFTNVPAFVELAKLRGPYANSASYPGDGFARKQMTAYPDLTPMQINRSVKETFEIVVDAARRQNLTIVSEISPGGPGEPGLIEAIDRTLILGLYDDVAIRVSGDDDRARVDLRSASRFGRNDLGQNAERMRALMKEIVVRLEETVPTAESDKKLDGKQAAKPGLKRGQEADPKPVRRRKLRDPSLSGARRAPGQKGKPPARGFDQAPGIQPGQFF
jgi:uncharacterized protein (DUF1499 family)